LRRETAQRRRAIPPLKGSSASNDVPYPESRKSKICSNLAILFFTD
jgi:hypothetical protein